MGVSENRGTPKSSILIGISIINHPFWGTPIFGNTQMIVHLTIGTKAKPTKQSPKILELSPLHALTIKKIVGFVSAPFHLPFAKTRGKKVMKARGGVSAGFLICRR